MSEILSSKSNHRLRFRFLGGCEIWCEDNLVHLETAKTQALLVYLVVNPGPQSRQTLAHLLWGELPEVNARRNLRRALWNLRQQLSSATSPDPTLSERDTVAFNRELAYWCDVQTFESTCTRLDAASQLHDSNAFLDNLSSGVDLYQGEFLAGFHVGDALAFEEWALTEREHMRAQALRALQHLVADCAAQNKVELAICYARKLLTLEPWLEEAHRWLMRLWVRSGQRTEALTQYEVCKKILAQDLGIEPTRETRKLYEQIRAGDFQTRVSNLPASTTPFIGRVREVTEVAALLARADCRLVTLTGLGGVGKTRLAREVATRKMASFTHGVHYVAVSALAVPERLASAVIQSLEIPFVDNLEPDLALITYLREKEILLVLDGFEQLLEGASLLPKMLEAAPGLKLLVTSRERLNLRGEWIFFLDGLDCPSIETMGDPTAFDATQLFMQTARRVQLGFQLKEGDSQHLARICNLVSGLPLAIELAAAWVRSMSLESIATEITQHLDFLSGTARDLPERQQSIRSIFDYSWQRLTEQERVVFSKLSVFRGSFHPQEAKYVTGASLSLLATLVDKSFLQRLPSGRYQVHDLLQHYAHEQLKQAPGELTGARDVHCQIYATSLNYHHIASKSTPHHQIVQAVNADLENILTAWQWAIQSRNLEAIGMMCQGLADYFQLTSSFRDGEVLFQKALDALGWPEAGYHHVGTQDMLTWELLSIQAMFSLYIGKLPQARTDLTRCMAFFNDFGNRERVAHCQFFLGEITRFVGDIHSAQHYYRQSLVNYQLVNDQAGTGFCLNGLGLVATASGELAQARSHFQESLVAFAKTNHEMGQAIVNINLVDLLIQQGELFAARQSLDTAYTLCQILGHRWGMASCLQHLGDVAKLEGAFEDAKKTYLQSLEILEDIGQRKRSVSCLIKLGQVCTELGQYVVARQYLKKAMNMANEFPDRSQMVDAALSLVCLMALEGKRERAFELLTLIERHPAAGPAVQELVNQLADELEHQLSNETFQLLKRRTKNATLEGILAEYQCL